jgi:uncharacterized protein YuzE
MGEYAVGPKFRKGMESFFALSSRQMVKPFTMHSSMGVSSMRIKHYQDTDTLYIELRAVKVAESRDLNENTLLDLDKDGAICGITIEHASKQVEISDCSFENL